MNTLNHNRSKTSKYKEMHRIHFMHRAFTLVELLVVMIVAGLLMAMVIAALRGAQEDANVAKTRATIKKIDTIIQDRYEAYRYTPIDFRITAGFPTGYNVKRLPTRTNFVPLLNDEISGQPESDVKIHSRIRLELVRDLMRFEMPDCAGDILGYASNDFFFRSPQSFSAFYTFNGNNTLVELERLTNNATPFVSSGPAGQLRAMLVTRAFDQSTGKLRAKVLEEHFNAELLFMIVEGTYIAGSFGIEGFSNSEIADVDGDGLREFIDAWGNPIQWIRWPAGYYDDPKVSQTENLKANSGNAILDRYNPDPFSRSYATNVNATIDGGDAFDPNKVDLGYRGNDLANRPTSNLRPLIVSSGPDGLFGIRFFWTGNNQRNDPAPNSVPTELFSLSDADFTVGNVTIPFPDPYHPRPATSASNGYNSPALNMSLGGVLNYQLDGGSNNQLFPVVGLIINSGLQFNTIERWRYSAASPEGVNQAIRDSVSDNVTNFDEIGGAL